MIAACAIFALAGCTHWAAENLNINGAQQSAVNDGAVRRVDLVNLIARSSGQTAALARNDKRLTNCPKDDPAWWSKDWSDKEALGRDCLETATEIFNGDTLNQDTRRNGIQARLLAASEAECLQFGEHLNSGSDIANLFTGIFTTGLAAAGSIVTDAPSARALAGIAGFSSGVRAEINADVFAKQAVPVIFKAINKSRDDYVDKIIRPKLVASVDSYPLWSAIGDAFRYNEKCSLVSGLEELQSDVQLSQEPGLDELNRTLIKVNLTQKIQTEKIYDSSALNTDATANAAAIASLSGFSGNGVGGFGQAGSSFPVSSYLSAVKSIDNGATSLTVAGQALVASSVLGKAPNTPPTMPVQTASKTLGDAAIVYQKNIKGALQACEKSIYADYQMLNTDALELSEQTSEPEKTKARLNLEQHRLNAQKVVAALTATAQMALRAYSEAGNILRTAIPPSGAPDEPTVVGALTTATSLLPPLPMPLVPPFTPVCS